MSSNKPERGEVERMPCVGRRPSSKRAKPDRPKSGPRGDRYADLRSAPVDPMEEAIEALAEHWNAGRA